MMSSPSRTSSNHTLSLAMDLTTPPPKSKDEYEYEDEDYEEEGQQLDSAISETLSISDAVMSTSTTTSMGVSMVTMHTMSDTSAGSLSDIDIACQFSNVDINGAGALEWHNDNYRLHDDSGAKLRPLRRHRRSSASCNQYSYYNHNHNHNDGSQTWSPMLLRYLEDTEAETFMSARWFGGVAGLSDDDLECDGEWCELERREWEWEWEWGIQSEEEEEDGENEITDIHAAMCCVFGDGGDGVLDLVGIGTWADSSCEDEMMRMDNGDDLDEWITGSGCA